MMEANTITAMINYQMLSLVMGFIMFIILMSIVVSLFTPRKSQAYRKLLADMFVAGKIKLLAKKEDINLAEEEKNFNLWRKKKRLEYQDLDMTIEADMKEKIAQQEEEDTEPKKKTKKEE